ncbi:hypothetical protein BC829DRAFT_416758 [Chytridium lagenaria]|nr:hypothetical protein BC829DRAFT_416758 [Chytridium lagenaria]
MATEGFGPPSKVSPRGKFSTQDDDRRFSIAERFLGDHLNDDHILNTLNRSTTKNRQIPNDDVLSKEIHPWMAVFKDGKTEKEFQDHINIKSRYSNFLNLILMTSSMWYLRSHGHHRFPTRINSRLVIAYSIPVSNPIQITSHPSFYGLAHVYTISALAALFQLRNREFRDRRIYQLELQTAQRTNTPLPTITAMTTDQIFSLSRSPIPETSRKWIEIVLVVLKDQTFLGFRQRVCGWDKRIVSAKKVQRYVLLTVSQTIRGLTKFDTRYLSMLISSWNPTDWTSIIMNAFLVNSVFNSVGPCVLTMPMFLIESLILLTSSILFRIVFGNGRIFLYAGLVIALSAGAAYNYVMEKTEQRFFALSRGMREEKGGGGEKRLEVVEEGRSSKVFPV